MDAFDKERARNLVSQLVQPPFLLLPGEWESLRHPPQSSPGVFHTHPCVSNIHRTCLTLTRTCLTLARACLRDLVGQLVQPPFLLLPGDVMRT